METNEISIHMIRIVRYLRDDGGWRTNHEVAKGAEVAERTARLHTKRLSDLGILDQAEVYPGHRYRFSPTAAKRNKGLYDRIEATEAVFGLT